VPSRGSRVGAARVRVDQLLVDRGLAGTRGEAARLVMAGRVRLGGQPALKAGQGVRPDAELAVAAGPAFVGRGGDKLAGALDAFGVTPAGRVCLDVGASTGGFTDCLLQRGARRVYAVDVGRGQLHPRLAVDPRVTALEEVNARRLEPDAFPERPDLATVDVSFISVGKVLGSVAACLTPAAEAIVLVKPQFEVGRGEVGRGGVVRDPALRGAAVLRVAAAAAEIGLAPLAVAASSLRGPKGNREVFVHFARRPPRTTGWGLEGEALRQAVALAVEDAG
jgi:23S rRNA (cytidine1920-2'-O)/16S rRNA (cytidine1409-2'-O)-methyltransferase